MRKLAKEIIMTRQEILLVMQVMINQMSDEELEETLEFMDEIIANDLRRCADGDCYDGDCYDGDCYDGDCYDGDCYD